MVRIELERERERDHSLNLEQFRALGSIGWDKIPELNREERGPYSQLECSQADRVGAGRGGYKRGSSGEEGALDYSLAWARAGKLRSAIHGDFP